MAYYLDSSLLVPVLIRAAGTPKGAGSLATMGRGLAAGQDPNPTAHTFAGQTAQDRHHPFHPGQVD